MHRPGRLLGLAALLALVVVGLRWVRPRGHELVPGPVPQREVDGAQTAEEVPSPSGDSTLGAPLEEPARHSVAAPDPRAASGPPAAANAPGVATMRVQLVDGRTEEPVAGIEVESWSEASGGPEGLGPDTGRSHGTVGERLRTDGEGRVVIEAPARTRFQVECPGAPDELVGTGIDVFPLEPGSTFESRLVLRSLAGCPCWLQVLAAESREPLVGVPVQGTVARRLPETDGLGFVLASTGEWHAAVRLTAGGRGERVVTTEPGHERPEDALVVVLERTATLRVHVTDATGRPVAGAALLLEEPVLPSGPAGRSGPGATAPLADWNGETRTDAEGSATFSGLPANRGFLGRITEPFAWGPVETDPLAPGEDRSVDWKQEHGCLVHGVILDQEGQPVAGHGVTLCKTESRHDGTLRGSLFLPDSSCTTTDDRGRFRFEGVAPGQWLVGPSAPEGAGLIGTLPGHVGPASGTDPEPDDVPPFGHFFEIEEGQAEQALELRVERGLTIRGRVLDPQEDPALGAMVSAFDPVSGFGADTSSGSPSFEVGPLVAGRYQVFALDASGHEAPSEPVEADAGARDVVLRLRPGASLSGRLVAPDGSPVTGRASLYLSSSGADPQAFEGFTGDEDGSFATEQVPPGRYDLSARLPDGTVGVLTGIVVSAGEPRDDLVVRMLPGGRVRVRQEGSGPRASIFVLQDGVLVDPLGTSAAWPREFAAPAGRVTVRAVFAGDDPRTVEREVTVRADETVDVVIEEGAR